MALKKQYAKKELIPAGLEAQYIEKNGVWVLDLDAEEGGGDGNAQLKEFRDNNIRLARELEAEKAERAKIAAQYAGMDPEKWRKAQEMIANVESEAEKKLLEQGKFDEVVARRTATAISRQEEATKAALKAKEAADARAKVLSEKLGKLTIEQQLARVLADDLKVKVRPGALDDVLARANRTWSIDDTGNAVAKGADNSTIYGESGKPIDMVEYARNLVTRDAKHLFESSAGGGSEGGKPGAAGDAPGVVKVSAPLGTVDLKRLAEGKATAAAN